MRVLITGAAGFLGRRFTEYHVTMGDEVIGIDNLSSEGSFWWTCPGCPPKYRRITTDALRFLRNWDEDVDLAYHFAAPVGGRVKIEQDPLYNAWSLALDAAFFGWAIQHTPRAVYPSSSAVYGVSFQREDIGPMVEEDLDIEGDWWGRPDEMYGFTKLAGEVLANKAAKYGLKTLCIRPFSGYGEGQSMDYPIPSICKRALERQDPLVVWGSGHQTRDFIHVDDLVGATVAAVGAGLTGPLNLGSGVPVSFVDVAKLAAEIVGYAPTIETEPSRPEGVMSRYCDPTLMLSQYQPKVDLRTGLSRVIGTLSAG